MLIEIDYIINTLKPMKFSSSKIEYVQTIGALDIPKHNISHLTHSTNLDGETNFILWIKGGSYYRITEETYNKVFKILRSDI